MGIYRLAADADHQAASFSGQGGIEDAQHYAAAIATKT